MADPRDSGEREADEARTRISARDARGAEIILRTRWMRIIFIAGLSAFAAVAIILAY